MAGLRRGEGKRRPTEGGAAAPESLIGRRASGEGGSSERGAGGKDVPGAAGPAEPGEDGKRSRAPRERPLKSLIQRAFHRTFLLSVLATVLTWALGLCVLALWGASLRPANYYESRIPEVVAQLQALNDPVSLSSRAEVEAIVPAEGMGYEMYDASGSRVYGSFESEGKAAIRGGADLLARLNDHVSSGGYYVQYEPLAGLDGRLAGAVALRYKLTAASANPAQGLPLVVGALLMAAAPFAYLYGFTVWSGRRLSRRLEEPFGRLIEGAEKIREHDLDFSLGPRGTGVRELNQLLAAFEQMREALRESLSREWQLERERRDMIAAVAHDLGTPLSVIRGHAEVLLEDGGKRPERAQRYAETILGAAERSIALTADLSEAARVERPDFALSPEPVDLEAAVRAKAREYAFLCRQRGAKFALEARDLRAEGERGPLRLDQHRINRVLDNLVSNTLRYAPEGGAVALELRIRPGGAEFEVRDDGPGFAEAGGGRIFEKFYREDAARASAADPGGGGHSGLGLFIARTIVRRHGGEIAAHNRPEGGACVRFSVSELD
ncbi:HAMP domain-containing sensor histidine kinase [Saccharibacillus alkalitolerans]|uniref:histidine kinase n=1 Tax=Saccharibacillus alkalitolerans TaxID=2705290 RepID=A0ABX0F5M5_9BACL|nr:HAMP domain-containing sensor histidine kinase [Saccharibacillus alkalitolerans]NGZ76246.1 HAMP domain-containing histidine kinase [Saccharibacillus alkalitolerans]